MTLHLMSHAYTTNNTRKRKTKITKSKIQKWQQDLHEYNKLMKRCNSKTLTIEEYIDKIHGRMKPEPKRQAYTPTFDQVLRAEESRKHREMYPSLQTVISVDATAKKEPQMYTGTLVTGIATMHKSNAVPVINQKQAIEISRMAK